MIRVFFIYGIPVFLPLAFFCLYRRIKGSTGSIPYFPLLALGILSAGTLLFFFSGADKAPATATYTPPKYVNGILIPAKMDTSHAP